MKIRLTKPLPQIGRVVPAGVILSDAPQALMDRLVRQGAAEWVDPPAGRQVPPPAPASLPFSKPAKKAGGRKKAGGDAG